MNDIFEAVKPALLTLLLAVPLIYGMYLKLMKKLTTEKLCTLIFVCGAILRLAYISYTDENTRQHDLGHFFEKNNYHSGYMLYLMDHHHLPDFDPRDRWQFYHPPLHHTVCALVLALLRGMGLDYVNVGPRVLQFLTSAYSMVFCVFAGKTMKRVGVKNGALALAVAVVTFHPTLIILSGSLNNDMLSAMFSMLAIYFTVRWAESGKLGDIIGIALSVGLGMMTKLTVGLLAPAIAIVFLIVLIKKHEQWKKLIVQFLVFGIICVPLGMFWPVRNFVMFGVPLNYVPGLSEESGQYIDVPALRRLFDYSVYQLSSPFTQWTWNGDKYNEFNPVIALMKNAMFDEETFFRESITLQSFCTALFFAGAVTAVMSAAAVVLLWDKREKLRVEFKLLITVAFAVIFGNYIVFCLNYPHVCTENMRYCVPLIFCGSTALGLMKTRADEAEDGAVLKYMAKISAVSMAAMSALSVFVYMTMLYYDFAMNN